MTTHDFGYPKVMTATGAPPIYRATGNGTQTFTNDFDDLWKLAEKILATVVAIYARNGIDLPERRYIALATPAQDCEQVTVSWQQAYIGPPGDEASTPQRCEAPRSAVYQVVITRCIPVVDDRNRAPAPKDISEASAVLMRDAWLLLDSVKETDDYLGVIATVEAGEAQGGLQSVMLTLTLGVS
jgi:hypothetical protein